MIAERSLFIIIVIYERVHLLAQYPIAVATLYINREGVEVGGSYL